MEYTSSSMSRLRESQLLLRNSIEGIRVTAKRVKKIFDALNDEFSLTDKRLLEIGAGSRGALMNLFDEKQHVTGIDKHLGMFDEGIWKSLKTGTRRLLFDPLFNRNLRRLNNGLLMHRKVLRMDATDLQFDNASFDFIFSRYLMEHIEDIDSVAKEIHRCLDSGGITYHVFALYTALDGAHTLDWKRYQPWEHLYGAVESNVYVNKYRLDKYREAFRKYFGDANTEIRIKRDEKAIALLDGEMRKKLEGYSDDELVAGRAEIICTKR